MNALSLYEGQFLIWIQNNLRTPALNPIIGFITHLGNAGILWIALTIAMICYRKTRRVGITCALSIIISFTVANLILKPLVARIRPYDLIQELGITIEVQSDKSFPSGHATNALACAWVMFRCMKRRYGLPALILALVICLTRLYVGVHYPTDVLAGIAIGIASAELSIRLVKVLRRRFPRFREFIRPALPGKGKGSRT